MADRDTVGLAFQSPGVFEVAHSDLVDNSPAAVNSDKGRVVPLVVVASTDGLEHLARDCHWFVLVAGMADLVDNHLVALVHSRGRDR